MFPVPSGGILVFLSLIGVSIAFSNDVNYDFNNASIHTNHRDEKLVGPGSAFTVARFANTECERDFHYGTCYTNWECHTGVKGPIKLFDTSTASKCQQGFGSCCITILGCGATSSNNNTYLRSPGYNSKFNYGIDCTQSIKIDSSICQLRMDISHLELAYPTSGGFCNDDYLKVSQDNKFEYLCGVTTENHFYIDVDASDSDVVAFQFHTSSSKSFDRFWDIRIQKIMCHTAAEVPRGCGQWFTGTSGTMQGFNIDGDEEYDFLIHGLNYGVCVRMEKGYCKISYTEGRNAWMPVCDDIFQRPADLFSTFLPQSPKCTGTTSSTSPSSYDSSFLAPHIFWLTTGDASNTHLSSDTSPNNYGAYDIHYAQTTSGCNS